MKKNLFALLAFVLLASCSEDTISDVYEEVNGDIKEKLIKSISVIANGSNEESGTITFHYNSNNQLTSISDGENTKSFIYGSNNEIKTISGIVDEGFSFSTLFENPVEGYRFGDVIDYDDNGNPKTIITMKEAYNSSTNTYSDEINGAATITYDNAPNPYFYTFEAAGLIDAMNLIDVSFQLNAVPEELVKLRNLFPNNNPSRIVGTNDEGETAVIADISYDYDKDHYPSSSTTIVNDINNDETHSFTTVFSYK